MSKQKERYTIGLLGQPNSGKSTLFNRLTGMHQHVGNWPGKTVAKKEETFNHNGKTYKLVDLPGTYSFSPNSEEEKITRDFILSGTGKGGRWFQNNLTHEHTRDRLSSCPDNQDLIRPGLCIMLWAGASMD